MVRTQVQFTEEQFVALKRLSAREGVSLAELVRRGVDQVLAAAGGVERQDRIHRALAAAGRFHSGRGDLSRNHDEYFAEDAAE